MGKEGTPQRESHVGGQMNGLNIELSRLHESIGGLTDRLGSVLVPEGLMEKKEEVEYNLVPLANAIGSCKDSVKDANFKIQDLTDRLELP
jgi:hypothetical protein